MPRRNRSRTGAMSALRSSTDALGGLLDAFLDTGGVTEEDFWKQLGAAGCQKELAASMAKWAKRGKRGEPPKPMLATPPVEFVTVPDVSALALLAMTKEAAGLTYVDPDCRKWGFTRDEYGKKYEVLTWRPGRAVSSEEVRKLFRALGASGNAAAFVAWVGEKTPPEGWYASIPEDGRCFPSARGLCAPRFYRHASCHELSLYSLDHGWLDTYCFVAFRELPA